jgi:hypothetical protein
MGVPDEEYYYQPKTELIPYTQSLLDKQADEIKLNFIYKWVINANLDLYKTDTERDWAYIVRKEYRFLKYPAILTALGISSFCTVLHSIYLSRISFKFYALAPFIFYYSWTNSVHKSTRKLFEILNVGSEYELGAERNRILEETNNLTRREDF